MRKYNKKMKEHEAENDIWIRADPDSYGWLMRFLRLSMKIGFLLGFF
jgi:hypothetical protein